MLRPVEAASAAEEAAALLGAVLDGELFAALPPDPVDRARHVAGVRLLELAYRRLQDGLGQG